MSVLLAASVKYIFPAAAASRQVFWRWWR